MTWFLQELEYILPGAFSHCNRMNWLNIARSKLKAYTKNMFYGMPKLKFLHG